MSYNSHSLTEEKIAEIMLMQPKIDVVCIQEAWSEEALKMIPNDQYTIYKSRETITRGQGVITLVRSNLNSRQIQTTTERTCIIALGTEKETCIIINTHFPVQNDVGRYREHTEEIKRNLKYIMGFYKNINLVLAGDMNKELPRDLEREDEAVVMNRSDSNSPSPGLQRQGHQAVNSERTTKHPSAMKNRTLATRNPTMDEGNTSTDQEPETIPHSSINWLGKVWNTTPYLPTYREMNRQLDYILTNAQITAWSTKKIKSDHKAIIANIIMDPKTCRKRIVIPNRKVVNHITMTALDDEFPLRAHKRLREEWKEELTKMLTPFAQIETLEFSQYDKLEETMQREIQPLERIHRQWKHQQAKMLTRNDKNAWRVVQSLLNMKQQPQAVDHIIDEKGETLTGKRMAKEIMKWFRELHTAENPHNYQFNPDEQIPEWEIENAKWRMKHIKTDKAITNDFFSDAPLKELRREKQHKKNETIYQRIARNKRNKRMIDFITKDIWKMINDDIEKMINGERPTSDLIHHLRGRIIAIKKKAKGKNGKRNIRLLTAMATIIKIIEARLLEPLEDWVRIYGSKRQIAFQPMKETQMHIKDLIEANKKEKTQYTVFIDFENAYPSVNLDKLYKKLEEKRIFNKWEMNILKYIHKMTQVDLLNQNTKITRGLPQGSLLSPLLFDIFINDLLEEVEGKVDQQCAYADDYEYNDGNIQRIKSTYKIVEEWSAENDMKINKEKSKIMMKQPAMGKKKNPPKNEFSELEWVDQYTYLGIDIDDRFNGSLVEKGLQEKTKWVTERLANIPTETTNPQIRKLFINTKIKPVAQYYGMALKLMAPKTRMQAATQKMRNKIRRVIGMRKSSENKITDWMVGWNLQTTAEQTQKRVERRTKKICKQKRRPPPAAICSSTTEAEIKAINMWNTPCPIHTGERINEEHIRTRHSNLQHTTKDILVARMAEILVLDTAKRILKERKKRFDQQGRPAVIRMEALEMRRRLPGMIPKSTRKEWSKSQIEIAIRIRREMNQEFLNSVTGKQCTRPANSVPDFTTNTETAPNTANQNQEEALLVPFESDERISSLAGMGVQFQSHEVSIIRTSLNNYD